MKLPPDDIRPLYDRVKEMLREQIQRGVLPENSLVPDKGELAQTLGVSDMTVRRALIELTKEGWLMRIRGRGTFVRPRSKGSAAAPRESRCLAVLSNSDMSSIRGSLFYVRLIQSMHQAADAHRASLTIKKITEPYGEFAAGLKSQGVAGLVLLGGVHEPMIKRLRPAGIPAVLLDTAPLRNGPPLDEVNHAGESISFEAVRELIQLGHERIGIIVTDAKSYFFKQRLDGYRRALEAGGISFDPELLIETMPTSQAAYNSTLRLLQDEKSVTAMFCTSDEFAAGALAAARDAGLSVPGDFSVAGYGDIGMFCSPALSAVRVPLEEMGKLAVETLLRRIDDPALPPQRIILECEWIARASTGVRRAVSKAVG